VLVAASLLFVIARGRNRIGGVAAAE
jgi:hypothetical protein